MPTLAVRVDQRGEDLDPPDYRHEIDAKGPIPAGVCPAAVTRATRHPGVVHEDVDLAIAGDRRIGGRPKLGLERDIGLHAVDVGVGPLQAFNGRGQGRLLDIAEHHLHAGLRQGGGDPQPDPGGGAGDKSGLARQVFHARLLRLAPVIQTGPSRRSHQEAIFHGGSSSDHCGAEPSAPVTRASEAAADRAAL
jgi:hypothetical protein